jgi:hypothetical protein
MINIPNIFGAESLTFASLFEGSDSDFNDLYKHWMPHNKWALFGLSVNPRTPLPILKEMLESNFADLAYSVIFNEVFIEMPETEKNKFFESIKEIGLFPVRHFLNQDSKDAELYEKANDPETPKAELTRIGNMNLLEGRETDSYWSENTDHLFHDEQDEGIRDYTGDVDLYKLIEFWQLSFSPLLKWRVLDNPNTDLTTINQFQSSYSLLGSGLPLSSHLFENFFQDSIADFTPYRVNLAFGLHEEDVDLEDEKFSILFEEQTSMPQEVNLEYALRFAHPTCSDNERIKYLKSKSYIAGHEESSLGYEDSLTIYFNFYAAATYMEDINALKELALTDTVHSQQALRWNPNITPDIKDIIKNQENKTDEIQNLSNFDEDVLEQFVESALSEAKIVADEFYIDYFTNFTLDEEEEDKD